MKAILRIFKYCRKRIIALSLENQMLKHKLEVQQIDLNQYREIDKWNESVTKH
jgi:hypothetical protein